MSKPKKIENLLDRIRNCLKSGAFRDTFHAVERKKERNITLPEIIQVLMNLTTQRDLRLWLLDQLLAKDDDFRRAFKIIHMTGIFRPNRASRI